MNDPFARTSFVRSCTSSYSPMIHDWAGLTNTHPAPSRVSSQRQSSHCRREGLAIRQGQGQEKNAGLTHHGSQFISFFWLPPSTLPGSNIAKLISRIQPYREWSASRATPRPNVCAKLSIFGKSLLGGTPFSSIFGWSWKANPSTPVLNLTLA